MHVAPTLDPNVTLTTREYRIRSIELEVSWTKHIFPTQYSVYSRSVHESRMISTYNNTVTLMLPYNSEYNITLVAGNCKGSSASVNIPFTVGECKISTLSLRSLSSWD